ATDLLFRHIKDAHRQSSGTPLPHKVLQGVVGHVGSGLHVVDAGPEYLVALTTEGMRGCKAADRVHGVKMTEDQDSRLFLAIPGRLRLENIAVAVAPGRAGGAGTDTREITLDNVNQAVDRSAIMRRSLNLHPAADTGENLFAVESRDIGSWGLAHRL